MVEHVAVNDLTLEVGRAFANDVIFGIGGFCVVNLVVPVVSNRDVARVMEGVIHGMAHVFQIEVIRGVPKNAVHEVGLGDVRMVGIDVGRVVGQHFARIAGLDEIIRIMFPESLGATVREVVYVASHDVFRVISRTIGRLVSSRNVYLQLGHQSCLISRTFCLGRTLWNLMSRALRQLLLLML